MNQETSNKTQCPNCRGDKIISIKCQPMFNPLTFEIELFNHDFICKLCNGTGFIVQIEKESEETLTESQE